MDLLDRLALMVYPVYMDKMGQLERLEMTEDMECKDPPASRGEGGLVVLVVAQDRLGHKACKDSLAKKESQEHQEFQERKVHLGKQDQPDFRDLPDQPENPTKTA